MIELRTLGAIELTSADGTSLDTVLAQPRRTALLCYLALATRRGFARRDTLFAMFWPEHETEQARHALRQSLYFLRRALGAGVLISRGGDELAVDPSVLHCDAVDFERCLDERRLEDALALYGGELLPAFFVSGSPEFQRWLEVERARLRGRAAEAAWLLAERAERLGESAAAVDLARRAAALSPMDETVLRRLVMLLDRLGDRAAAVRAYEKFVHDLEREYELTPSEATRALLSGIRAKQRAAGVPDHAAESRPEPAEEINVDGIAGTPPRVSRTRALWRKAGARVAVIVLLVGAGVAGWRLIARAHPPSTPHARERILVAEFENRTTDSTLGEVVTQILRSDLARSKALGVVGTDAIEDAFRRMRRPAGTRLTGPVAREVAARDEIKLTIEGDVRWVRGAYVISATAVETASGEAAYGASEIAPDSTQILAAIARLSAGIRRNVGESIATIRASDSLYWFTTPSFPALRKHMLGTRAFLRGDYTTAATLEREAIALDSTFAYAHLELWVALANAGLLGGNGIRPLLQAYALRDRLTDWERYAVEGAYNLHVLGDVPQAIAFFRRHLDALNQLSIRPAGFYANLGEALELGGDPVAGRDVLEEARAHHPTAVNQAVLVRLAYSLGDQSEATRVLDEAARRYPDHPVLLAERVRLLADSGRYEEAHALARRIPVDLALESGLRLQAEVDALRGRFDEAASHLRSLRQIMSSAGDAGIGLELAAAVGTVRLAAGDSNALADVDSELVEHPLASIDVYSRPYLALARLYAAANRPGRAKALIRDYEREYPAQFRNPDRWLFLRARAALERAEGKTQAAIADLQAAQHVAAIRLGLFDEAEIAASDEPELARLYEQLGARDSAIAGYERYLTIRSLDRPSVDAIELAPTLRRLAVLYEKRGDRATAARYYRQFAALWRGGDSAARRRASDAERRASMLASSAASP